jgi:hypothetical protein
VQFLSKLRLLPVALAALLIAPLAAVAQTIKPVAIVSVASIKENLADAGYLTRTAGMEDAGKSAMFFANALTAGIDKEKPMGLFILPQTGGDFPAVAFLPVKDLKVLLEVQKEYLGTPKEVGNGILEVGAGTGRTSYIKEQSGWVFAATSKNMLTNLPQDPVTLLADLPTKYNVAAKLMVQNVPPELRRMLIDQIKFGMERGFAAQRGGRGNADNQGAQQMVQMWLGQLDRLINEADELVVGLGVDAEKKRTVLDIGFSAKEGTGLARQMALQMDLKSNFAGFVTPDAAVTISAVSRTSPEDIQQVQAALKSAREMWSKQLDDAPDVPAEKREAVKRVLGQIFDVIEKTAVSGRGDFGGSLILLPKSLSFVGGGYIADGPAMEKALRDGLELAKGFAKNQADFPKVEFNVGTHGDVKLHRLTARVPGHEPEVREVLGEQLEIIVGIGPQSVMFSGGKDAEGLLKKAVDRSASEREKTMPPAHINIALLPILKFYKSVDDNPIVNGLIASLEQSGNDKIVISSEAGPRSSLTHIEIQEGIVKAGGEAAKALGAGANR